MKKLFIILIIFVFTSIIKAQDFNNIDIKKLNIALSEQTINGFTFDSVSIYYGIIGSYKDADGNELVISFDSLSKFEEVKNEDPDFVTLYKNEKSNLIFFQNEYITALYIELPKFNVTMSLTSGFMEKSQLETVYNQINPEDLLNKAVK
ncbi:MAG: hypothetical protein A2W91_04745 [Bacteroidetes bacterium GWF2_38_335]|nr:MAG: hypothetical protein A2W91_04745 [Bacteroidetes bacterium GWF2_38_335]OFY80025.1 MAG: hypothetical protein A2281_12110 [Bacteroidetes bacterium RIFOXYA12_FULL_38_20]HBS85240.1 hypothetical protein [Bacteroidales bacterium]